MSDPEVEEDVLVPAGFGACRCRFCGTVYDNSWVDLSDYMPPVGDGCAKCMPDDEEE